MDQTSFIDYWNEAVLALIYDIHQMKLPIRHADINRCWKKELLDCRFFSTGIRHGAAVLLSALDKESPDQAAKLREALAASFFHVGSNASQAGLGIAGFAAAVAGGWIASQTQGTAAKIGGVTAGLIGLGMMTKSGAALYAVSDADRVCRAIRKEADLQLKHLLTLF